MALSALARARGNAADPESPGRGAARVGFVDERETFSYAAFAAVEGSGYEIGPVKRGNGVTFQAVGDCSLLPLSVSMHAASYREVTMVQLSVNFCLPEARPEHRIGDKAYDGGRLDEQRREQSVDMIAPHWTYLRKLTTQGRRKLCRYARFWIVEHIFAWMQRKRRQLVRWDCNPRIFLSFI